MNLEKGNRTIKRMDQGQEKWVVMGLLKAGPNLQSVGSTVHLKSSPSTISSYTSNPSLKILRTSNNGSGSRFTFCMEFRCRSLILSKAPASSGVVQFNITSRTALSLLMTCTSLPLIQVNWPNQRAADPWEVDIGELGCPSACRVLKMKHRDSYVYSNSFRIQKEQLGLESSAWVLWSTEMQTEALK